MKNRRFSIINVLFKRRFIEEPTLVLFGNTVARSRKPQYYACQFNESAHCFFVTPVSRSEAWSLMVDFKTPETVTITVQGSPSLISDSGIVIAVTGNLVLKQTSPQDFLSIYAHGCGIKVSGCLTSELSNMAIHCSHGPAILAGGNIVANNISALKLVGTEPTLSVQDISLLACSGTTAEIAISGGLRAGGNVRIINGSSSPAASSQTAASVPA